MGAVARLPHLRTLWERSLDTTCTIQRFTSVDDTGGGQTDTWANLATSVPCRLQPALLRPNELPVAGRAGALDYWDVQLRHDQDVTEDDRIVAGSYLYEVQGVTTGRSLNYGLTARCVRVQ